VAALEALVVLGRDVDKGRWSKSVSALLEDHAPEVRRKAAEVAGYLQLLEVRPLLLRICEDRNQDVQVRTACVESLSLLGGAESVKACTLLLGDSNQWLRRSSIRVIALHGDKKDHELLTALLYDPVPQVRLDAARALAFRGQKINDDRLAKDLSSENPESRVEAIRVIGLVGTPEAVDKAVERFKDPAWEVRVAVARMLASIRSTQHGAILKTLATDSDLRVRAAAVRSKAILEQEKCIGDLRDALSDKDSAVVGTALEFLIRLEAVDKLKELAELVAKKEFPQNVHSSLAIAFATRGEIQLAKSLIMGPQQLSPDIRIAHNLVQLLESRPEMTAMIVRTADLYGKNFGGIMKVLADSLGSGIGWNFVPERATWIPDTWIDAGDQVPLTHVIGSTLNYYVVGLEFENKSIVVRAPHDPRPRPEDK
jgi:HEAT repeat protein